MADRKGNSVERYYAAKQKRQKKRKSRRYVLLTLFSLAVLLVLSLTVFFNIRSFAVQGNKIYSTEQIIAATGLKEGNNLFRLNKFKIADKMMAELPYIGQVEIYRKLPTTLCIDVAETRAAFVTRQNGGYAALSDSLKVLSIDKQPAKGAALLIGDTLKDPQPGQQAVFAGADTAQTLETLIPALRSDFEIDKVSAVNLTDRFNIALYYDNNRVKISVGNTEALSIKFKMAMGAIGKNSLTEPAVVDVTNSNAAYYRSLSEDEKDDVAALFAGKTADADKTDKEKSEDGESDESSEKQQSDEKSDEKEE